jgi:CheY-like chemotaxis protein
MVTGKSWSVQPREVVVVDDDSDTRESVSYPLESHGYSVISAANGREALDYLKKSTTVPAVIMSVRTVLSL